MNDIIVHMTLIDSPDTLEDVPDLDLTAPLVSEDKPLRSHQARALAQITDMHQARGIRRVLACGPTGCGKSRLGRAVAENYPRALCLTHTRGLLEQNRRTICRTVMIQQIAIAAKEGRLEALLEAIGEVDLVIEDEAHHYASKQWSVAHKLWTTAKRLGLTATPMRGDGKPLRPHYDELVTIATYSELIKAGILVPAVVEYPEGTSTKVGRSMRCNAADAWLKSGRGLRTMIFCEDTEHSRRTVQDLEKAGVRAAHVDGDTSDTKRTQILDALASGDLDVVSNCNVLTEGIDVPSVECVLLAKGYDTMGAMIQAAGRGLRSYPATGKSECLVLDCVGCTHTFGAPDDDKTYSLDGNAMDLQPGKIWVCGVCYRCFGPKIAGTTPESWTESGGLLAERELSAADLEARERWEAKRSAAFEDKAGREWISKKQVKERTKNMRDYRKKLALQVGAMVMICSLNPQKEWPKHTPCPHCAKERPRGNHEAKLQRKNPAASGYGNHGAPLKLQNPTNVEQALQSLTGMFERAMARNACLTSAVEEFKRSYGVEVTVGWAKVIDARHQGKFRKHQEEWCDKKIKEGAKPGMKFFRVTKFFAAR